MRQEPFHRRGAHVEPVSHASPWWIYVAILLALVLYFRSAGYVVGKWMDRWGGCTFEVRR
jgi:hypothetical protein